MRAAAHAWILPLTGLLAAACATVGSGDVPRPAPVFTRAWGPYTPEDLNRDVVGCAEESRRSLSEEAGAAPRSAPELRRELHERTVGCMRKRGWKEIRA